MAVQFTSKYVEIILTVSFIKLMLLSYSQTQDKPTFLDYMILKLQEIALLRILDYFII